MKRDKYQRPEDYRRSCHAPAFYGETCTHHLKTEAFELLIIINLYVGEFLRIQKL